MSAPDFIPDDEFKPDEAQKVASNTVHAPDFIPDDQFESDEDKYGTTSQQLVTGLESAGSAATFGLSKGLERLAGVKPEDIEARERENPLSSFAGSTAGLVGSSLLIPGGGAAGLMEAAGAGTAAKLGLGAAEAGLASRAAAHAVKAGIEGAIFQGGNEVGKMVLGDPDQTIGTAAANMGLAGLIGGAVGGTLGLVGEGTKGLWKARVSSKLESSLSDAQKAIESESGIIPSSEAKPQDQLRNLGIFEQKENAPQIKQDLYDLGLEPAPGVLEKSKTVGNMASGISKRGSLAGIHLERKFSELEEGLGKQAESLFRDRTTLSPVEVDNKLGEGLKNKLTAKFKPIKETYKELEPEFKKALVPEELRQSAQENILNHEYVKNDPEMQRVAEKLSDRIGNITNVHELRIQKTKTDAEYNKLFNGGGGSGPEGQIYKAAIQQMRDMRGVSLNLAEEQGIIKPGVKVRIDANDAAYSEAKKFLKEIGVEANLGKPKNLESLMEKVDHLNDGKLASKIFNPNNYSSMLAFQKNFPEEFDLARRALQNDIYKSAISSAKGSNQKFLTGVALRHIDDIGPEARALLFNGTNSDKIRAIQNVYTNLVENVNPSGTSVMEALAKMLTPAGMLQNFTDAAQLAFLKAGPHLASAAEHAGGDEAAQIATMKFASTPGAKPDAGAFKSMVDLISNTIKGENLVGKSVKNVFKEGEAVLPSHLIPDDKSKEKLDKKLKDLQANNEPLLNVGDQVGHYMPEHSGAIAQVAMQSVNYLNSIRPSTDKQNPLDSEVKPSEVEKAAFDNALAIAQQPLIVLKDIKNGNVTQQDLMHLKSMYPALYTKLQSKLQKEMIDAVHKEQVIPYKTRLGLSIFLGQPLDSTMTPQAIMAAQPKAMNVAPQGQGQQSSRGAHSMKALSKLPASFATLQQAREASRLKS